MVTFPTLTRLDAADVNTYCSHPIDVVKTRLQVSGSGTDGARNYKALGISGTVRVVAAEEGYDTSRVDRLAD